jgi:hypothetical protein
VHRVFKLVLPAALVLVVVYALVGLWRAYALRNAPKPRTWALFVGRSPIDRMLARRVRKADPTAIVAVYGPDHALAARLGVTATPALVLGDGAGGVRERAIGRAAILALLAARAWTV